MLIEISTSHLMALRTIVADRIRDTQQIQSFVDVTAGVHETTTEQLLVWLLNPAELAFCPRVRDGGRGPCVVHDGAIAAGYDGPHEVCIGCSITVADELKRVAVRYLDTKMTLERLLKARSEGTPSAIAATIDRVDALVMEAGVGITELLHALEESVRLQAHYAQLLNMHDGGQRIAFPDAQAWLQRLRTMRNNGTRPVAAT